MKSYNLSNLKPDQSARVSKILPECRLKQRFSDIGLIEGTQVKCVGQSPGKNMKAYLFLGTVIAIRDQDCLDVLMERGCDDGIE